jgi:hypothetical protein
VTVDDMLAVLKVVTAASTAFGLSGIAKRVWQKLLGFLAAIFFAHLAYLAAGSVALLYHWIVLPDFLINLFMPGFAIWGAILGVALVYGRERIRTLPKST